MPSVNKKVVDWPNGDGIGGGPDTLRANYGRPQEDGTLAGQAGDCFFQFVEWDKDGQLNA